MSDSQAKKPSRRGFMLGAAVAGAAAGVAVTIPRSPVAEAPAAEAEPPKPEAGGGYRLSEHVKRYYKSTLV